MKLHHIVILIVLLSQMVCATASQLAVSPYIHRGLSFSFSGKYNPSYVELIDRNNYGSIYALKYGAVYPICTEMLFSYGIKERVEISFLSMPLLFGFRGRLNVTILNKNENPLLFKNYALSAFIGGESSWNFYYQSALDAIYGGVSIGTKKVLSSKTTLELFASPTIVYSYYRLFLTGHDDQKSLGISLYELDVPLAARMTFGHIIKFSIKAGGTISFLLSQDAKETQYHKDYIRTLNHIPISAFIELAVHFGRRKENKERRKQLLIDLKEEEVKSVQ